MIPISFAIVGFPNFPNKRSDKKISHSRSALFNFLFLGILQRQEISLLINEFKQLFTNRKRGEIGRIIKVRRKKEMQTLTLINR